MAENQQGTPFLSPPGPPSPSQDAGLIPDINLAAKKTERVQSPPLNPVGWDVDTLEAEVAMKMLARSVQALARVTGEVPPTPPLARPTASRQWNENEPGKAGGKEGFKLHHRRTLSRPGTPIPSADVKKPGFDKMTVGTPEAEDNELTTEDVESSARATQLQQLTIARKFFCKIPPPVSLEMYLTRLQRFCPMSTAVYLAAGSYIQKLCIEDRVVPATSRTVHRLVLASLRVAMKALEDLRYPQERFAIVGGVKQEELRALEISLCYLMDFELQVDHEILQRRMGGLLQAAGLAGGFRREEMTLKLPMLGSRREVPAA